MTTPQARAIEAALSATGAEPVAQKPESGFNDWWLSLPEGRRTVLVDDKWMLAEAAYRAAASPPPLRQESEKDAERYRWLRDTGDATWRPFGLRAGYSPVKADAAIDAAIAKDRAALAGQGGEGS